MWKAPSRSPIAIFQHPQALTLPRAPCLKAAFRQPQHHQTRTFLDALLSGSCPRRTLTHTKTIPYSQSAIFKAVSDVSGYPSFLPFTISSDVTSRDKAGYPTRAKLRVGYDKFGLEENWDSVVSCDPETGVIEARSNEGVSGGLFEVLSTKWHIGAEGGEKEGKKTEVRLDVEVKFRNPVYDQMFAQVEAKVASTMISAFEKRVREIEAAR